MQKIVALDIGSYSIKALEIINTFKTHQFQNFYELKVPEHSEEEDTEVLSQALETLFKTNNLNADQIVTAMPGQYISYRILPFNYNDPKKIELTIEPTLEDIVPFNLEDMIISHQILGDGSDKNKSNVLAVMTRKNYISNFLTNLKKVNIDPKFIDVDSISLFNLNNIITHPDDECYGILDLGHLKSSLCIILKHELKMFRTIYLGGKFLTEFLATELGVSYQKAEEIKHTTEAILPNANIGTNPSSNSNNSLASEHLMAGFDNIINELVRTMYAFKQICKIPVTKFFISGGTSKIKNIDQYLSNFLNIPIIPLNVLRPGLDNTPMLNRHKNFIPQGVAIGLKSVGVGHYISKINLRKDEFAYSQNYDKILEKIGLFAKIATIIILVLGLNYGIKYFMFSQKINLINKKIKGYVRQAFPERIRRLSRYKSNMFNQKSVSLFKEQIQNKKDAQIEMQKNLSANTTLEILDILSKYISEEVKIDTQRLKIINGSFIELKGDTTSFEAASQITNLLKRSNRFETVKEISQDKKPGTEKIIFTLHLTLKTD